MLYDGIAFHCVNLQFQRDPLNPRPIISQISISLVSMPASDKSRPKPRHYITARIVNSNDTVKASHFDDLAIISLAFISIAITCFLIFSWIQVDNVKWFNKFINLNLSIVNTKAIYKKKKMCSDITLISCPYFWQVSKLPYFSGARLLKMRVF